MIRYFFDIAADSAVRYDYRGRDFQGPDQAREYAQLIALDLGCSDGENTVDGEIQVRDLSGSHLFSIKIPSSELVAA